MGEHELLSEFENRYIVRSKKKDERGERGGYRGRECARVIQFFSTPRNRTE